MKIHPVVMVWAQLITTAAFATFFTLLMTVRYPGSEEMLKQIFWTENVPYSFLIITTLLNLLGMCISTVANITMAMDHNTKTRAQLRKERDKSLRKHGINVEKFDEKVERLKQELKTS